MAQNEQRSLIREVKNTCTQFGTCCKLQEIKVPSITAFTTPDNTITYSSGVMRLPINKARAILYHEMAHLALKHPQTWKNIVDTNQIQTMRVNDIRGLRHMHEYQADNLTSFALSINRHENLLDVVLMDIVPENRRGISTTFHPSINNRVQHIQYYKNIYKGF